MEWTTGEVPETYYGLRVVMHGWVDMACCMDIWDEKQP